MNLAQSGCFGSLGPLGLIHLQGTKFCLGKEGSEPPRFQVRQSVPPFWMTRVVCSRLLTQRCVGTPPLLVDYWGVRGGEAWRGHVAPKMGVLQCATETLWRNIAGTISKNSMTPPRKTHHHTVGARPLLKPRHLDVWLQRDTPREVARKKKLTLWPLRGEQLSFEVMRCQRWLVKQTLARRTVSVTTQCPKPRSIGTLAAGLAHEVDAALVEMDSEDRMQKTNIDFGSTKTHPKHLCFKCMEQWCSCDPHSCVTPFPPTQPLYSSPPLHQTERDLCSYLSEHHTENAMCLNICPSVALSPGRPPQVSVKLRSISIDFRTAISCATVLVS